MTMHRIKRHLTALLLVLATGSTGVQAQGINPDDWPSPPEPALKYKVTVGVTPAGAGNPSGAGKFVTGGTTNLYTSDVVDFRFRYWTLNGEQYTTSRSFTYTVTNQDVHFVAVYEYDPELPDAPLSNPAYRLFLSCQPTGACSFSRTSGLKTETGSQVSLSATPNQDFEFVGWYEGETKVSSDISFSYTMTAADHHLVARFAYNPADPFEPTGSGQGVDNTDVVPGDANGDGAVDVKDVLAVIDYILEKSPTPFVSGNANVNSDNSIDVKDVLGVIDIILSEE